MLSSSGTSRSIGSSFESTDLTSHGFFADWNIRPEFNLCTPGGDEGKVDKFVEVCEKVGYINSDEILAQFADAMRKRLHPRDVAGRFDGTALMVLLERGKARDAEVWGKQLCADIAKRTFEVGDLSTHLTCTVGVCAANEVFSTL